MNEPYGQITLQFGKLKDKISDDEYFEVCQINEFLVIERNQNGDWEIKSLNGFADAERNSEVNYQIGRWADTDKSGVCFGAFTGFILPNGAARAADFTWIKREKWEDLSLQEKHLHTTHLILYLKFAGITNQSKICKRKRANMLKTAFCSAG